MANMKLKPGVITGSAMQELFAYCKEAKCALPAVNVIGSHTANAALQAAKEAKAPIFIQLSQSGSQFYGGKALDNSAQQASIAGSISGALHVRTMAEVYGVPVHVNVDELTELSVDSLLAGFPHVAQRIMVECGATAAVSKVKASRPRRGKIEQTIS